MADLEEEVRAFKAAWKAMGMRAVPAHSSHVITLAAPAAA